MNLAKTTFVLSLLLFAGIGYALYREMNPPGATTSAPLVVYCAEALRIPLTDIAQEYEREVGGKVELRLGPSQAILTQLQLVKGDLFLPADDSFIELARKKDLVAETVPLAKMHAVVITRPGLEKPIKAWADVVSPGMKLGLANPDAAAIGKLTREHLRKTGLWDAFEKRQPVMMGNINEVGTAVQLGTVDAGILFDAVTGHFPKATVVRLPELDGVVAQVQIALAKSSTQPTEALCFARYVAAADRGLKHLEKHGFKVAVEADSWAERPELLVYSGAMLRPAIEKTVAEFEQREGVRITTVYNGCGILVGQMKTGERPDVYFACDQQFMKVVQPYFEEAAVVSNNHLVIAVRKGNPKNVLALKDLGQPGLKVGVGHEQQCALGQITKETFLTVGLYSQIAKNVAVTAPTGDLLVVQLRGGSLDAVVVYQSNVTPYQDIDGIPVTGIACANPQQPVALSRTTRHPQLARRLLDLLQTPESKKRFEELGFGWEVK